MIFKTKIFVKMNLLNILSKNDIEALIIKDLNNIFYLTGQKVSFWIVILTRKEKYFISDSRYIDRLKQLNWWQILNIKDIWKISDFIKQKKLKSIGIESDAWSIYEYENFVKNLENIKIKKLYKPFEKYRMIKNEDEIKKIKSAIKIIEKTYEKIYKNFSNWIYLGKSELSVRKDIITSIFDLGWEGESFESIVAFWKATAIPHWQTSKENLLSENQPVLIDMGAIFQWYCSDFTRSFWFWKNIDTQWQKIFDTVRKAHDEARKVAIPWNKISDVDKKARQIIEEAWYWKYFTHATGHWIWIQVHEYPIVYKTCDELIQPWMVFTIEPWIYLPWKFGVRWENIKIIE